MQQHRSAEAEQTLCMPTLCMGSAESKSTVKGVKGKRYLKWQLQQQQHHCHRMQQRQLQQLRAHGSCGTHSSNGFEEASCQTSLADLWHDLQRKRLNKQLDCQAVNNVLVNNWWQGEHQDLAN